MNRSRLTGLPAAVAALLLLLLAGCRSNDTLDIDDAPLNDIFNADGEAYLCLSINIGEQAATRAPSDEGNANGQFGTEEPGEYAVNDAIIALFTNSPDNDNNESEAKLHSAYRITPDGFSTESGQLVSSKKDIVIRVTNDIGDIADADSLYVLALLNTQGRFAVSNSHKLSFDSKSVTKLADLTATTATMPSIGNKDNGFFMASAPLSNVDGGAALKPTGVTPTAHLLTMIERYAEVFHTATQAQAATPKHPINVERAAAKLSVELNVDASTFSGHIISSPDVKITADKISYLVDRYNSSYYVLRHFDDSWLKLAQPSAKYRFSESGALPEGKVYRTTWANDVNYTAEPEVKPIDGKTLTEIETLWMSIGTINHTTNPDSWGEPFYMAENTIDADNMTLDKTTAVILRLQLHPGDFYTTSLTGDDNILTTDTDNNFNEEWGTTPGQSLARGKASGTGSTRAADEGSSSIWAFLRSWLMENNTTVRDWAKTHDVNLITFEWDEDKYNATDGTIKIGSADADDLTDAELTDIVADINSHIVITRYTGGYCYYRVPIKHFGQALTPWQATTSMGDFKDYNKVYPNNDGKRAEKYLGRYGVVRNNWYHLVIDNIAHVGSAVIPAATSVPDDFQEEAIKLKISTQPWTVHTEDHQF